MLSSRYTEGEFGPPVSNSMRIVRPIAADGTSSCSTGALALEKPAEMAEPPVASMKPDKSPASAVARARYKNRAPHVLVRTAIVAPIGSSFCELICGQYCGKARRVPISVLQDCGEPRS